MIIETKAKPIERFGTFIEESFSIKDTAFILELLRSKIYSNPIKTCCQEIMSNARDTHREMGKDDVPIQIKLPNAIDTRWICRDYGIGITPERMSDIFIKYGASSKRESNEFCGGFGIGSKTPFAVSDAFGIETYCPEENFVDAENNTHHNVIVKRVYVAFIDETRVGKLSLTNAPGEITTEPQGTSIIVTVKKEDFNSFNRYTKETATYWDTRPNIIGNNEFKWPAYDIVLQGDKWCLLGGEKLKDYELMQPLAVIDGIPYRIQENVIREGSYRFSFTDAAGKTRQIDYGTLFRYPIRIYFNTGELMLAANREEIDYKNSKISLIKDRISMVLVEMRNEFAKKIAVAANLWDAHVIWKEISRNTDRSITEGVLYKGFNVSTDSYNVGNYAVNIAQFLNYGNDTEPRIKTKHWDYLSFEKNDILVLNDNYGENIKRSKIWTLLKANPGKRVSVLNILSSNNIAASVRAKETLDAMNKEFGFLDMQPLMLSKIAATPIPYNKTVVVGGVPQARRKQYTRTYDFFDATGHMGSKDYNLVSDNAYYIFKNRNNYGLEPEGETYSHRASYEDVELLAKEFKIEIVIAVGKDFPKMGKGWINVKDLMVAEIVKIRKTLKITKSDNRGYAMANAYSYCFDFIREHETKLVTELAKDSYALEYYNLSKNHSDNNPDYERMKRYCRIVKESDILDEANVKIVSFTDYHNKFAKKYPLLSAWNYYTRHACSPEHLVEYCNLCEGVKKP